MATAIVTLKVTPNELQHIKAALDCYAEYIEAITRGGSGMYPDLTAAENEPLEAVRTTRRIIQDIGLKS